MFQSCIIGENTYNLLAHFELCIEEKVENFSKKKNWKSVQSACFGAIQQACLEISFERAIRAQQVSHGPDFESTETFKKVG